MIHNNYNNTFIIKSGNYYHYMTRLRHCVLSLLLSLMILLVCCCNKSFAIKTTTTITTMSRSSTSSRNNSGIGHKTITVNTDVQKKYPIVLQEKENNEKNMITIKDDYNRRSLAADKRTVLIIRILDNTQSTESTQAKQTVHKKLMQVLFEGNGSGGVSVKEQMKLCSAGQVILDSIGILDATVTPPNNKGDRDAWVNIASLHVLENHYNINDATIDNAIVQLRYKADHVIIILPTTFTDTNFLATAEVSSSISIYHYNWQYSISTYMHEIAHNIMLRHSHYQNDIYGDTTGYMGRSTRIEYIPKKCYNPANHWQLNWFVNNRVVSNTNTESTTYTIAAFVDVQNTNHPVIMQLDSNKFLQFNRAKLHNEHTDLMRDQITIVQDNDDHTMLLAGLSKSQSYSFNNKQGQRVNIQICDIINNQAVDYATIGIGTSSSPCTQPSLSIPQPTQSTPTTTTGGATVTTTTTKTDPNNDGYNSSNDDKSGGFYLGSYSNRNGNIVLSQSEEEIDGSSKKKLRIGNGNKSAAVWIIVSLLIGACFVIAILFYIVRRYRQNYHYKKFNNETPRTFLFVSNSFIEASPDIESPSNNNNNCMKIRTKKSSSKTNNNNDESLTCISAFENWYWS